MEPSNWKSSKSKIMIGDGTLEYDYFNEGGRMGKVSLKSLKLGRGNIPTAARICFPDSFPSARMIIPGNNKVAFRFYGLCNKKMIEDKVPGGTLSVE